MSDDRNIWDVLPPAMAEEAIRLHGERQAMAWYRLFDVARDGGMVLDDMAFLRFLTEVEAIVVKLPASYIDHVPDMSNATSLADADIMGSAAVAKLKGDASRERIMSELNDVMFRVFLDLLKPTLGALMAQSGVGDTEIGRIFDALTSMAGGR